MKKILALLLATTMTFSIVACSTPAKVEETPAATTAAEEKPTEAPAEVPAEATEAPAEVPAEPAKVELKMAMVTDTGGIHDESFNASAWKGHEEAKEKLGLDVWYVESKQESEYAPNLESIYDGGAGLIWGIGFLMGDVMEQAATKNTDRLYAVIDYTYDETTMPKNLIGIAFKEQEPSFVAGYVAAKMSKSGKIGFVGGMEIPVIARFQYGFKAGAKYANKDIEVLEQYCQSFTDAAVGKSVASKMYQDGADIVFHAAGGAGNGVITAAVETGKPADGGKWVIGVDQDQNYLGVDNVLTSVTKGVTSAIFQVASDYVAGTLTGGVNRIFGYAEDGVAITTTGNFIPADLLAETDSIIAKIKSGEIVVPGTVEEFDVFITKLA